MVQVKRIVADLGARNPAEIAAFYRDIFDLDSVMDMGWIVTLGAGVEMPVQLSVASEGGGGAPVPHLSIEVDDVAEVLARVDARGVDIAYPLTQEPWGVLRFFLHDPAGRLVNVLQHT